MKFKLQYKNFSSFPFQYRNILSLRAPVLPALSTLSLAQVLFSKYFKIIFSPSKFPFSFFQLLADQNRIIKQFLYLMNRLTLGQRSGQQQMKFIKFKNEELVMKLKVMVVDKGCFTETILELSKNQVSFKLHSFTYLIKLSCWTIFEPFSTENNEIGFYVILSRQEQYKFFLCNKQQLEICKCQFLKFFLLRGFYTDYKPIKKIGQGKSASVFLAKNRVSQQQVAIKAFSKQKMLDDSSSFQALQNQIRILRQLKSINLLKLNGFYETQKSYYMVTQYVDGCNLRQVLQYQEINYFQIIVILKKLLEGLNYLAEKGIAHRDLKPENIVVSTDRQNSVIVDFGLAVYCQSPQQYVYRHCGTPGFIAPEILNESEYEVTTKSDIFSLGIVFHLMLLKKFPYKNPLREAIIQQNRQANFDFSTSQYRQIPTEARILLEKMLQKDHRKRISAKQILLYFQKKESQGRKINFSPLNQISNLDGDSLKKRQKIERYSKSSSKQLNIGIRLRVNPENGY